MIGITLPTAPGLIGNWQFACILALSIYGINKNEALAFSLIYHFCTMSVTILLGLIFFPFINISVKTITSKLKNIKLDN